MPILQELKQIAPIREWGLSRDQERRHIVG